MNVNTQTQFNGKTVDDFKSILKQIPSITLLDDMVHPIEHRGDTLLTAVTRLMDKEDFTPEAIERHLGNHNIALHSFYEVSNGYVIRGSLVVKQ
jgi:hypothetical protein